MHDARLMQFHEHQPENVISAQAHATIIEREFPASAGGGTYHVIGSYTYKAGPIRYFQHVNAGDYVRLKG